jgi:hypothetical protein
MQCEFLIVFLSFEYAYLGNYCISLPLEDIRFNSCNNSLRDVMLLLMAPLTFHET